MIINLVEQSLSNETVSEFVKNILSPFMEPESSLQYSHESATGPSPEPDESSAHPHFMFL
jgi:hypothetical protein